MTRTLENIFAAIAILLLVVFPYALDSGMYFVMIVSLAGCVVFANLSVQEHGDRPW